MRYLLLYIAIGTVLFSSDGASSANSRLRDGISYPFYGEKESEPLFTTPPAYPPELRKKEIQGEATLLVFVDVKGNVIAIDIVESKPAPDFGLSAKTAVQNWRFPVHEREGKPIAYATERTMIYKIQKPANKKRPAAAPGK